MYICKSSHFDCLLILYNVLRVDLLICTHKYCEYYALFVVPAPETMQDDQERALFEEDSFSQFSSDPSQISCQYSPVKRPKVTVQNVVTKKKRTRQTKKHTSDDPLSDDPLTLLQHFMQLVQPKPDKKVAMRRMARALRSSIQSTMRMNTQSHTFGLHCPNPSLIKLHPEAHVWASGSHQQKCQSCGMNHVVFRLVKAGNEIYGISAATRKQRIKYWMEHGTAEYIKSVQKQIQDTWIGDYLKTISARHKVTKNGVRRFSAVTAEQV